MTCHPGHEEAPAPASASASASPQGGHAWWMWALCLLPVGAIVAMTVFSVPFSSVLWVGILLLCPLLHVFMMRGHGHGSTPPAAGDTLGKVKE